MTEEEMAKRIKKVNDALKRVYDTQVGTFKDAVKFQDVKDFINKVKSNLDEKNHEWVFSDTDNLARCLEDIILVYCYGEGEKYIEIDMDSTRSSEDVCIDIPTRLYSIFEVGMEEFPMDEETEKIIDSITIDEWEEISDSDNGFLGE